MRRPLTTRPGRRRGAAPGAAARTLAPSPAFTLIEMLVVLAIIAILVAIILPVFATAREHARRNACTSNLQKIGVALQQYYQDQGAYPPDMYNFAGSQGLRILLGPPYGTVKYLSSIQDLHCPDNVVDNSSVLSTTTTVGYDNYNGPDQFSSMAYGSTNTVSTETYTLSRLSMTDNGDSFYPADYSNPDYTRQLKFKHPDEDTVVTWCTEHRPRVNNLLTPDGGKNDIILYLDGKVMVKTFQAYCSSGPNCAAPPSPLPSLPPGQAVTGQGLHRQTDG